MGRPGRVENPGTVEDMAWGCVLIFIGFVVVLIVVAVFE